MLGFHRERTLLTLRKHPLSYAKFFLLILLLAGLGPLVYPVRHQLAALDPQTVDLLSILFGGAYYLYVLLFALYVFSQYRLDIWKITEKHIVNIEQGSVFNRTIAKQELEKVQDMETKVNGLLATLFDYGTIYIQSAGTTERIIFHDVPHPHWVVDVILKQIERLKEEACDTPARPTVKSGL